MAEGWSARARRVTAVVAVGAMAGAGLVVGAAPAGAATFPVTNTNDAGAGSLRQAVADASAAAGPDTIVVQEGLGTIVLTSGTINYPSGGDVVIEGNGVTVDANGTSTAINNGSNDAVTIDGFTFTGSSGNAVNTNTGDLTIQSSTFTGNERAANSASGSLSLIDSTITMSTGTGDPINTSSGELNITRSRIVDNAGNAGNTASGTVTITDSELADNARRGFNTASGSVTVVRSTISGHEEGRGLNAGSGTLTVINSTISGNTASGGGGGVNTSTGDVNLVYATIVGNSAPTVANVAVGGVLTTFGSVIAEPGGGVDNCDVASTTSQGHNYSDDATCGLTATGDTQDGADPQLGALADNGGPTPTHLPADGSPLLDAIPVDACQDGGASGVDTDQRGVTRPQGDGCDIGSVEIEVIVPVDPVVPVVPELTPSTTTQGAQATAARAVTSSPSFTG